MHLYWYVFIGIDTVLLGFHRMKLKHRCFYVSKESSMGKKIGVDATLTFEPEQNLQGLKVW